MPSKNRRPMRKLWMAILLTSIISWSACATTHPVKFKKSRRPQVLDSYIQKFNTETWEKDDRLDLSPIESLDVIDYIKNLEDNPTWE